MSGPRADHDARRASPYTPGSPMLRALMEDRSFFTCYESLQLAHGAGPDRPQVFDANPGERVSDLDFSPNELTFSVDGGRRRRARDPESELGAGLDEHCGADRGRRGRRSWRRSRFRQDERPLQLHVPAAAARRGPGAVRHRARSSRCWLWRRRVTLYFFRLRHHDRDRIALRRHGKPRDRAELMRRGVEHFGPAGAPRVHDMIFVPADIRMVLPSGIHA